jgi:putative ABC transport system permease protein
LTREAIARIDPLLAFFDVRTMLQLTDRSLQLRRTVLTLAFAFAVAALFLSAIGVYGVLDYVVSQRKREFGIRLSLGCTTQQLFKMLLKDGMRLVGAGLAIGLFGVWPLRKIIEGQLFGVRSADPVIVGAILVILAGIAAVACVLPARRACKVDPSIVLNQE